LQTPDYIIRDPAKISLGIGDDDLLVSIKLTSNGSKPETPGLATVRLSTTVDRDVRVPYSISLVTDNNSNLSDDIQPLSGFVIVPKGATTANIQITPVVGGSPDLVTLTLTLLDSPAYQLAGDGTDGFGPSATVNLSPSLGVVSVAVSDSSVAEPANSGSFTVTLARSGANDPVAILYQVQASSSATPDIDYVALSGSVTVPSGGTSVTIPLTIIDDTLKETPETVVISLLSGSGYTLSSTLPTTATVTITDDEPLVSIARVSDAVEGGALGIFRISLGTPAPIGGAVVKLEVDADSTAIAGTDYSDDIPTEVTIPEGDTTFDISITPANDDGVAEPTVGIILNLVADVSYEIDPSLESAALSILDAGAAGVNTGKPSPEPGSGGGCGAGGLAALLLGLVGAVSLRRRR
jgi:hypothetical protein